MKRFRLLLAFGLLGILLTYSGCGSKSDPTISDIDKQSTALTTTWVCSAATLNGSAVVLPAPNASYTYVGTFKLAITTTAGTPKSLAYTASGRPTGTKVTPWPASGNFDFGTDATSSLTRREDNLSIAYTVSATQLMMTFTTNGSFAGYDGRAEQVQGAWSFTFTKL